MGRRGCFGGKEMTALEKQEGDKRKNNSLHEFYFTEVLWQRKRGFGQQVFFLV